ncbi:MAG: PadR family transcriptional regulator [Coriobacteriia bacterium]|nr:PadR family transcriptional regulator [Coriobacteriia bacterium]
MRFTVAGALLDACVLGLVSHEPAYGYELTQRAQAIIDVSESTLYPVLRRLQKEGMLSTFDRPFDGRNRRYYEITDAGKAKLEELIVAWNDYTERIDTLLIGEKS